MCTPCEQLFGKNGESEVLRWIAPKLGKSFPLADRLRVALPFAEDRTISAYSGPAVGVDTDKFAYFALSVVWRNCVHDWTYLDGEVRPNTALGDFQEQIRQYLLGLAPFPPDMVVLAIVGRDDESRNLWTTPHSDVAENCINFHFLIRGVAFRVLIGYGMPDFYRNMCCTAPRKCLFFGNMKHRMPEIMRLFDESPEIS